MTKELSTVPQSRFGDLIITWDGAIGDPAIFDKYVDDNMEEWMSKKVPSLWLVLSCVDDLTHLPHFISKGFEIHRTKPNNIVILNRWIRPGKKNLPSAPFAFIGACALVINSKNEVLAVRENYVAGPSMWKFPGGMYDPSIDKNVSETAIRECFEETHITAHFESILCQRFLRKGSIYEATDVLFVVKLQPENEKIEIDPVEIFDAKWIPIKELREDCHPAAKAILDLVLKGSQGFLETDIGRNLIIYSCLSPI